MKTILFTAFVCCSVFLTSHAQTLNLNWVKTLGNSSNMGAPYLIEKDNQGNLYVSGGFIGTVDFDPGSAVFNLTSQNTTYGDNYLLKLDPNGNFLWVKQWNFNPTNNSGLTGGAPTSGFSFKVNTNGIYITGSFTGTTDFNPSSQLSNLTCNGTGWWDAFLLKLDLNGNFQWVQNYGGTLIDSGRNIAIDNNNNIYLIGYFSVTADFNFSSAVNNVASIGGADVFILKLDQNGNFIWVKTVGGNANDDFSSIDIDSQGNIYFGGGYYASSTIDMDPGTGVFTLTSLGNSDFPVGKLDANGTFLWARNFGNSAQNSGFFRLNYLTNEIIVTGVYTGTMDLDPGSTVNNASSNGGDDVFIISLNSNGNYVWSRTFGGAGADAITGYAFDSNGNIITTGFFSQTVDFDPTSGTNILASNGLKDIFVSIFSSSGLYIDTEKIGGVGDDIGYGVNTFLQNNIYLSGIYTNTVDFDPNTGVANQTSAGSNDTYILKLNSSFCGFSPPLITSNSGANTFCNGGSLLLGTTAVNGLTYQWKKNGVNIAGATSSTYLVTTAGVYTLEATNSNGCSQTSNSINVSILPVPIVNAGSDITVCSGVNVTLNATGAASYSWSQGISNGISFTPPNGTTVYTVIGTAANGCTDSDQLTVTVNPGPQMTAGPDITICPGDQVTLYVPVDTSNVVSTTSTSGTYIADSSAQPYANSIQVSGFPSGSQITSAADLQNICIDIEHSYLGDVDMWLQCPSGQYVPLINSYNLGTGGFLPGGVSGGGVFLGDPIDDITGPPGDGWQYCFSSVNATSGIFMNNIFNTIPLSIAGGNNADGYSMDPNPIYLPETSFSNLVGCPVNGTWTLFVQDVWQIDDGYIFDWSLDFGGSLNTGTVGTVSWNNGVTNNVPFSPSTTNTYTVTATNSFGCTTTDQVTVTVLPASACNGGAGNNTFTNNPNAILPFSQANFIPTVIDYNIDGKDDVYGHISHQPNSNRLWINNGNSTFTDISTSVNFPVRNGAMIADFDKDGYSDVYYKSGDTILIYFRQNAIYQNAVAPCGVYLISSLFGVSPTAHRQVQFNDFNNDGVHDLIVQIQSGNQSILKAIPGQLGCQTGCNYILTGTPQTLVTLNTINNVYSKLADLDNDGDMDIMLGASPIQYQNSTYGLYSNDGTGVFSQVVASNYVIGRENAFGTVGELNNDGIPDIISGAADCCVSGDPL